MFWQARPGLISSRAALDASPAVSNSVWGDHGTNITLSTTTITNDTVTNGNTNAWSTVRGAQAYSTGKRYFEIKCLTANAVPNLYIGIIDNTTANGAAMDDRLLATSVAHLDFNGNVGANGWNGVNLGAPFAMVANDYMGVAIDFDAVAVNNGFGYLSLNGTYFLSGDPTSGATGTGAVYNGGFSGARPMMSLWGASTAFSGIFQLITGSSINPAHIPSGYSAWA